LTLELPYRPDGLLTAKPHLKNTATVTTEDYAHHPGEAHAELLPEVNKHEAEPNQNLAWTKFRTYQQDIMPTRPGARELTKFFTYIDANPTPTDTATPKVQRSNRFTDHPSQDQTTTEPTSRMITDTPRESAQDTPRDD
jgi:hypothetical protein